jgi:uncharacterized integral membrane protein
VIGQGGLRFSPSLHKETIMGLVYVVGLGGVILLVLFLVALSMFNTAD